MPLPRPSLQHHLARLAARLDKYSFGDVWRAAALGLNRFMFNYIATESGFTRAGGWARACGTCCQRRKHACMHGCLRWWGGPF